MKKLIVITGASSGIGEATARAFSKMGHPLLLLARRIEKLEKLNLPNSICAQVDVKDIKSFRSAVKIAEEKFGTVDCLINNAGIMLLGEVHLQSENEWHDMFDVNVLGLLNGIKLVINSMIENKAGTIINISSIAGKKTFPNHAIYTGTKFAVHSMSEAIREEVAKHNIRVTTIAPGAVETELLGHTTSNEIINGYENWKNEIGGAINSSVIADTIAFAYNQPQSVCIREIVVAATKQQQ